MKITNSEYEAITKEMVERMKDIVFISANRSFRKVFTKKYMEEILDESDEYKVRTSYVIEFLVNDLKQVLARGRRK